MLLTLLPDEERHTGVEAPPVWWQVEIDGTETAAMLFGAASGASGLLAWLVLADDMPRVAQRQPHRG